MRFPLFFMAETNPYKKEGGRHGTTFTFSAFGKPDGTGHANGAPGRPGGRIETGNGQSINGNLFKGGKP